MRGVSWFGAAATTRNFGRRKLAVGSFVVVLVVTTVIFFTNVPFRRRVVVVVVVVPMFVSISKVGFGYRRLADNTV
jgi:fatty-acid desaturase